jgi:TRAP-type C4-dicarboxylate transport system substrate-binding protein
MKVRSWAARALAGVAVLGLGLGLAACGSDSDSASGDSTAAASGETTLNFGYVTTPQHPYGLALQAFADKIKADSGGALTINLLPTYGGGDDLVLLDDIVGGTVDGGTVSAAVWGGRDVHDFEALQLPFLINGYGTEAAVLNSPIAAQMLEGASKLGVTGLAIHEGGLRKPLSKGACLKNPGDFKGVKIRSVPSPVLVDGLSALGANPVSLPLSDVYLALKQGTADAMEANLGLVFTQKFYEVSDCITANVNLWPFPTVLNVNTSKWDSLTAEQQGWITDAAAVIDDESITILTNPASTLVADLCATGLKFGAASKADAAALRTSVDSVYAKYTADEPTGGFVTEIEKIKAGLPAPPAPKPLPAGCAE